MFSVNCFVFYLKNSEKIRLWILTNAVLILIYFTESTAIFRYLSRNNLRLVDKNLYPIDIVRFAKVDEILYWYHNNLRKNSSGILFKRVFSKLTGEPS